MSRHPSRKTRPQIDKSSEALKSRPVGSRDGVLDDIQPKAEPPQGHTKGHKLRTLLAQKARTGLSKKNERKLKRLLGEQR